MSNVTSLNCRSYVPNTGFGNCNLDLSLLLGWIAVPRGTKYTASQLATIVATLATAAQQNPPASRAYPIGTFVAFQDKSTDTVVETTDYGAVLIARDGTYIWSGRTINGNFCLYQSLRKFHGKQDAYDMIAVFKNGLMLTYVPNPTTGAMEATGIRPSLINVPIHKSATGTTAAQYWFEVQIFDAPQIADRAVFVQTDTSALTSVSGIVNVDLQNNATVNSSPAGSVDIIPVTGCGGDSLVDIFGSTLNSASLWSATNLLTGATITITGVSIVAGKYRIQLDTTDTDYPASSGKYIISLALAATLYAAGVIGYESNAVTLTRP